MRNPDVVNMLFGSHLYGLQTENSDFDYKGIYLPTLDELLLNNYQGTYKVSTGLANKKNAAGDLDTEVISLPKFMKMAIEGETMVVDMLHGTPITTSDIWESIVENRTKFYSQNLKAFVGYVKRQAAKYGVKGSRVSVLRDIMELNERVPLHDISGKPKLLSDFILHYPINEFAKIVKHELPQGTQTFYEVCGKKYQTTLKMWVFQQQIRQAFNVYGERALLAESNEGVDWKAMSHALRAGYQAKDIYIRGDFNYPLDQTEFLLAVKTGKLDFTREVAPELEKLVQEVDVLAEKSILPEKVDKDFWDNWLLDTYRLKFNL